MDNKNKNLDFDNLPEFKIPDSFFDQLFELTGFNDSKGFILCFLNQDGSPIIYSKSSCKAIEMGCRKALEEYLEDADSFKFSRFLDEDEDDFC